MMGPVIKLMGRDRLIKVMIPIWWFVFTVVLGAHFEGEFIQKIHQCSKAVHLHI